MRDPVILLFALGFGILVVAVSLTRRRAWGQMAESTRQLRRDRNDRRLETWAGPRERYSPAAWTRALDAGRRFTGWWAVMLIALFVAGFAVYLVASAMGISLLTGPFTWLEAQALICAIILGITLAYAVATRRTRAAYPAAASMELERRGAGDFVSPLAWVAWLLLIALTAATYLVFELGAAPVTTVVSGYARTWSGLARGEVALLASLFTLAFAGFAVQWIASSPALEPAPEDTLEPRAEELLTALNDAHRAQAIGTAFLLSFLGAFMTLFLTIPGVGNNNLLSTLAFFAITPFIGIAGPATGRLGGRLTGWWWAPWPARQASGMGEVD